MLSQITVQAEVSHGLRIAEGLASQLGPEGHLEVFPGTTPSTRLQTAEGLLASIARLKPWNESAPGPEFYQAAVRSLLAEDRIMEARRVAKAGRERYPEHPSLRRLAHALYPGEVRPVDLRDEDRTLDFEWLKAHSPAYRGNWVALLDGSLVACAPKLKALLETLLQRQDPRPPLIHRIA